MIYQFLQTGKKIILNVCIILAILSIFIFTAELGGVALAQSPITVRVDRTTLTINDQVTLSVIVTGDFLNIPNPDLSQLQDFVVLSSRTSTQVSIVNGQMSSQKIFFYRLQPLQVGVLVIGSLSFNIDGQIYQTEPIQIDVLAGGAQILPSEDDAPESPDKLSDHDFFVEAEVDNVTPYLGEQAIYIFRIYQAIQAIRFPLSQSDYLLPSFTDFWSSEVLSQSQYDTDVAGRRFLVTEIRIALFPANLGSITIEPSGLIIPGGLLYPEIRLETNPVIIEVQPLPENAPDGFNGAVGQFEIKASLSEDETKVNEPVTLVVELKGIGNIQTLTEPALPELPYWRFFDSQATTVIDEGANILSGVRTFERLIVPGQPGRLTFPPISFSYFDPQAEVYRTITTNPVPITVLPDDSIQTPVNVVGVGPDNNQPVGRIAADIRHIKPVPTSLNVSLDTSALGRVLYWSGWLLPLLAVGIVYVWQSRQRRLRLDTAYARDQRARRVALKILADARYSTSERPANAAGHALLGYLSDKLNTPTAGLTTNNLVNLLRQSRLEANLVDRVETLLHQIDIGRFAPAGRFAPIAEESAQSILTDTQQLINDLEKSFGKRR